MVTRRTSDPRKPIALMARSISRETKLTIFPLAHTYCDRRHRFELCNTPAYARLGQVVGGYSVTSLDRLRRCPLLPSDVIGATKLLHASRLPPRADNSRRRLNVRFVPIGNITVERIAYFVKA